jgi:hypothetical protein
MKYFIVFILSFMAIGCGSGEPMVRVEYRSGVVREFKLLAVRDRDLLVGSNVADTMMAVQTVLKDDIARLHGPSSAKTTWMWIGAAVGFVGAGVTVGIAVSKSEQGSSNAAPFAFGFLAIPSMLVGGVLGYLIPSSEREYNVRDAEDWMDLRDHSVYPHGEPPELYDVR